MMDEALTGSEELIGSGLSVKDYWSWAHSDIIDNTERGFFAEYLVHLAVGENKTVRQGWGSWDVLAPEGIRIEVKASGYIQSWEQKELSSVRFDIAPDADGKRQSDIYVFCLHKHKDKNTVNVLDLSQWTFFVMPTSTLDAKLSGQKSIALSRLIELGAVETSYIGLRDEIITRSETTCENTH